jgi:hypothetical protein
MPLSKYFNFTLYISNFSKRSNNITQMKNCNVIFDTNAYRDFGTGKTTAQVKSEIQSIKAKEQTLNIKALMSPVVTMEILSHLSDSTKWSFEPSKKAIIAQYGHCGDNATFKMIADPEMLLCKMLFNVDLPTRKQTLEILGKVAYEVWTDEGLASITKNNSILQQVQIHIANEESEFAKSILGVIGSLDPTSTNFHLFATDDKGRKEFLANLKSVTFDKFVALGFAMKAYLTLYDCGIITQIDPNIDLKPHIEIIKNKFKASIELYRELYKRIVGSEFDLNKDSRANFLWDIHLLFTVGDEEVNNEDLYFVTGDKAMLQASNLAGQGVKVLKLSDYLLSIGHP